MTDHEADLARVKRSLVGLIELAQREPPCAKERRFLSVFHRLLRTGKAA